MIDTAGFRLNVGMIITNGRGKVFWAKRINQNAWQFPQGGINAGEDLESALFRELQEEVGLTPDSVTIVQATRHWLRYKFPPRMIRNAEPVCIGQKQKWYLLNFHGDDQQFIFNNNTKAEFDGWQWVNYWYPLRQVINFKKEVYRKALRELAPAFWKISTNRNNANYLQHILSSS